MRITKTLIPPPLTEVGVSSLKNVMKIRCTGMIIELNDYQRMKYIEELCGIYVSTSSKDIGECIVKIDNKRDAEKMLDAIADAVIQNEVLFDITKWKIEQQEQHKQMSKIRNDIRNEIQTETSLVDENYVAKHANMSYGQHVAKQILEQKKFQKTI